jgi:hypothetical protein
MTTNDAQRAPRHDRFREAVEAMDLAAATRCFHEDATFHSPAVHRAYEGRDAVTAVLGAVLQIFEDFAYTGEFTGADGRELLEFRARVGDREVQGVDLLTFDADGLVTDLTVLLRPLRGLEATVAAMGRVLQAAADG